MTTKRQCDGCEKSMPIAGAGHAPQLPSFRGILPIPGMPGGYGAVLGGPQGPRGLHAVPNGVGMPLGISPEAANGGCLSDWITVDPHGCGVHTLDFCSTACAAANVERVVGQLNVRIDSERKELEKHLVEHGLMQPPGLPRR